MPGPLSGTSGSKKLPAVSLRGVNPDIKTAYAHTMSLTLERQVSSNVLASLGYSGSRGENLYDIAHDNLNGYGTEYLNTPCSALPCLSRLNTQYSNINLRSDLGNSAYNSLIGQLTFKDVAHTGVTLQANYTWSHALDDLSSAFSDGVAERLPVGLHGSLAPEAGLGQLRFRCHAVAWRSPPSGRFRC